MVQQHPKYTKSHHNHLERKEALIQSQTTVLEAQEEAIITKVRADAESDAIITAAINEAEAIEVNLTFSKTHLT